MTTGDLERVLAGLREWLEVPVATEDGQPVALEDVQRVVEAAVKLYARMVEARETEQVPPPLPERTTVTVTEGLILVNELLEQLDVDIFELGLFRQMAEY